jgi:4-hydroxybenzoate polyprenyltransferase
MQLRTLQALLTIIRFPNLVFIALTQIMVYGFIVRPAVERTGALLHLNTIPFLILMFSTLIIAAAGYMINDYFDIGIDAINKPHKVTIEKIFKRRSIIIAHVLLNILAIGMAIWAALQCGSIRFIWIQFLSIFLLTIYSSTFKRKLIIGNLMIATLTALTVLSVGIYEPGFRTYMPGKYHVKLLWVYTSFAFIITWIREIVKDIEDVKGDSSLNCRTVPLVWGINSAKTFIHVLLFILMILILAVVWNFRTHTLLVIHFTALVFFPLGAVVFQLKSANTAIQFHKTSSIIKWITLTGIISMIFI